MTVSLSLSHLQVCRRFAVSGAARWLIPLLALPLACQGPDAQTAPKSGALSDAEGPSVTVHPAAGTATGTPPPLAIPAQTGTPAVPPPAPLPLLAERDASGKPVLYYGRVQITDPAQPKLLKVFGFVKDIVPFFDDYRSREVRRSDGPVVQGPVWIYAIASGAQWNFLRRYPGLVGAMEMNPRLGSDPHPILDSFLVPGGAGALDTPKLIAAGFTMQPLKLRTACKAAGGSSAPGVQPAGIFGDVWDAAVDVFEDVGSAVGKLIAKGVGLVGSELATVLEAAIRGVIEAIDFIRMLANSGYCAIAGSTSNTGIVYVNDNNGRVRDVGSNSPAPLRWGTMNAAGGPLNILHTETSINRDGRYRFDDLCKGLTYELSVEYDADPAELTSNGFYPSQDTVTKSTGLPSGEASSEWDLRTAAGIWFMGAQLGWDFSVQQLGFAPNKARINHGAMADAIGAVNQNRPFVSCNQQQILAGAVALIPGLNAVAAVQLDADIFAMEKGLSPQKASWIGVAVHEYGHHAFCAGLDRYGPFGAKEAYVGRLMGTFLDLSGRIPPVASNNEQTADPVRNSAEAWADIFAYRALGYTDYVSTAAGTQGQRGSSQCAIKPDAGSATSGSVCLEPDVPFRLPEEASFNPETWPGVLASRLSVMYDWMDATGNDDKVAVSMDTILRAATSGSSNITTESIATSLTSSVLGQPPLAGAEDMCEVFLRHGWPCTSIAGPVALEAPTNFDGAAFDSAAIAWSWSPSSTLADQYVVVTVQNGVWVDGLSTPSDGFTGVLGVADLAGNTPVTAAIESRRAGSPSARSTKITRCTAALEVKPLGGSATFTSAGVAVEWTAPRATRFRIRRRPYLGSGVYTDIATVDATGSPKQTFVDAAAPPGVRLLYLVDAINCDGVVQPGSDPLVADPSAIPDDPNVVYVQAGALGGTGSRTSPVGTFADALPLLTASRNVMAVSEGSYRETVSFDQLPADIGTLTIFGGYEAGFGARDPLLFVTRLVGTDGFANQVSTGVNEFRSYFNPLLRSQGHDLRVEGVFFTPASRTCAGACSQLDFFYGRRLELVDSRLEPTNGTVTPGALRPPVVEAQSCTVDGTTIEAAGAAQRDVVRCTDAVVGRSEIFAGGGSAVVARNAAITGSVIRGSSTDWSSLSSGAGIVADACLFVQGSLVAGRTAINSGSAIVECSADRQGIFRTLTYGEVRVSRTRIANSVLVGERAPVVSVVTPTGCETDACLDGMKAGNLVKGNLFVQLDPGNDLAGTAFRVANGLGPLPDTLANDSDAWFGPFPNDVADNRTTKALAGVFDLSVVGPSGPVETDPTYRGNRGRVFHFAPGYDSAFGVNLALYGVPLGLTLEQAIPDTEGVGPY